MINATKAAAETLLGERERGISLFLDFELYITDKRNSPNAHK
jgi:hypothetical protein